MNKKTGTTMMMMTTHGTRLLHSISCCVTAQFVCAEQPEKGFYFSLCSLSSVKWQKPVEVVVVNGKRCSIAFYPSFLFKQFPLVLITYLLLCGMPGLSCIEI